MQQLHGAITNTCKEKQYFAPENPSKCAIRRSKTKHVDTSPFGEGNTSSPNPTLLSAFGAHAHLEPQLSKHSYAPNFKSYMLVIIYCFTLQFNRCIQLQFLILKL